MSYSAVQHDQGGRLLYTNAFLMYSDTVPPEFQYVRGAIVSITVQTVCETVDRTNTIVVECSDFLPTEICPVHAEMSAPYPGGTVAHAESCSVR